VEAAVRRAQVAGGRVLLGGARPAGLSGYFFSPTVVEGVSPTSELAQEELFGPVVTLHAVSSLEQAIDLANGTRYGLAASVATRSLPVADAFLERVQAGLVHVNQPTAGVEYQVPFGGIGESGLGPKEQGWSALDFYGDWKTAVITPS
jgi:acyl-CoA reductase-like NAD-dependent aldehyde dehydrogenase